MVEFRRIINFGKSSHVVSLPKTWLDKNKLKKGDLVAIEEQKGNLILSPKTEEVEAEPTEITIEIDGKDIAMVQREVVAAYINNINVINLTGKSLQARVEEIRDVFKNLIALEVIEQTSSRIVARDFLSMESISILNLIKKMDFIVRDMISDSKKSIRNDDMENIIQRDIEVNRFAYLLFRTLKYALGNEKIAKLYKASPLELLNRWWVVVGIEEIGDCTKRIVEFFEKMRINKNTEKELLEIYSKIEKTYLEVMNAYYDNNPITALALSPRRSEIIMCCNKLYAKCWKLKGIPNIIEQFNLMINTVQEIGRLVYRYNY